MKDYEKLEVQAKLMRLVEGTDVDWEKCVKHLNRPYLTSGWNFESAFEDYAFAFAIVEGKPVFKGNVLHVKTIPQKPRVADYYKNGVIFDEYGIGNDIKDCSWNAPKPKTVTIAGHELPLPDGNEADFFCCTVGGVVHRFKNGKDVNKWINFLNDCIKGDIHD
jgi:hypothetical protein